MAAAPEGLLAESAPLAWREAPLRCRLDPGTGERCDWFHGPWQSLRLLGIASTPESHAAFYSKALDRLPAHRPARVLVCGTADYALPAQVVAGCRARGIELELTVIDQCETPLWLVRWHAERAGYPVQTLRSDALEFQPRQPFDAIVTHSFLVYFDPLGRARLAARWRDWLVPGGFAATISRLRPGQPPGRPVGFTPERAEAFVEGVMRRAAALPEPMRSQTDALRTLARRFAERSVAWPIESAAELVATCRDAGFQVECDPIDPPRGLAGLEGPSAPGAGGLYAGLLAVRPAAPP